MVVLISTLSLFAGVFIDLFLTKLSKKFSKKDQEYLKFKIKKLRVHHSTLCFACIYLAFIANTLVFIFMALGLIISHSLNEGSLLFIEYGNRKFF